MYACDAADNMDNDNFAKQERVPPVMCNKANDINKNASAGETLKSFVPLETNWDIFSMVECIVWGIRELKKKCSGKKMIKPKASKRLSDDCQYLESYILSNTVHDVYKLDGGFHK